MRFEFEVGDTEKHRAKFHRDPWFGRMAVRTVYLLQVGQTSRIHGWQRGKTPDYDRTQKTNVHGGISTA